MQNLLPDEHEDPKQFLQEVTEGLFISDHGSGLEVKVTHSVSSVPSC